MYVHTYVCTLSPPRRVANKWIIKAIMHRMHSPYVDYTALLAHPGPLSVFPELHANNLLTHKSPHKCTHPPNMCRIPTALPSCPFIRQHTFTYSTLAVTQGLLGRTMYKTSGADDFKGKCYSSVCISPGT